MSTSTLSSPTWIFGVGDDVGAGGRVAQGVLVALVDVVDQAFVQGPGVHLAFPVVDDGVAEAERFALQVRHARGDPGFRAAFRVSSLGLARNASMAVCRVFAVLSESLYTA
jgi:hypothetical protein